MDWTRKAVLNRVYDCVRWCILPVFLAASVGCKSVETAGRLGENKPACYVLYDVGSSRSRLYLYEQVNNGWRVHKGPGTAALADPIRGNRGKTMADAGQAVDDLVGALDDLRADGPPNSNGIPRWLAFDWQRQCRIAAAYVYGTAGMRIAGQHDAAATERVWAQVRQKLTDKLGAPVTARTLSAYEEGLFAWLARSETLGGNRFGVAELGGGSLQVTFPCGDCDGAKAVRVGDRSIDIYSHSFLGWGQDEAWKAYGQVTACQRGAGVTNPSWKTEDCEAVMHGFAGVASSVTGYIGTAAIPRWYLSDAFFYMKADDIGNFCQKGLDSGFEPESSCFRAVYQQYVLKSLALPPDAEKSAVSWTLGAIVCETTRCLEARPAN